MTRSASDLVGTRRRAVIGALASAGGWAALGVRAQTPDAAVAPGDGSMQQRLDRWRAAAAAAQAAETPERRAQRLRERAMWLERGEAALARGDDETALMSFERAAQMEHAADTEMSLVRAYMQTGEYRRAVSFGAHTAGAHRQVVAGAVLYSWLLSQGGQDVVARRLLEAAAQAVPDPLLDEARRLLVTPSALPAGDLLAAPVRLAPYARGTAPPSGARVAGSAVLIGDGAHALLPRVLLRGAPTVWLRNGLGQTVRAQPEAVPRPQLQAMGLAVVRLATDLPVPLLPAASGRDPFPGSPGSLVSYTAARTAAPAWPRLHVGFHGMPDGQPAGLRLLGIEPPRAAADAAGIGLGGPVFDAAGRWAGIAVPHADGRPRAALLGRLRPALGALSTPPATGPAVAADPSAARMPVDEVYESALRVALQVITRA